MGKRLDVLLDGIKEYGLSLADNSILDDPKAEEALDAIALEKATPYTEVRGITRDLLRQSAAAAVVGYVSGAGALNTIKQTFYSAQAPALALQGAAALVEHKKGLSEPPQEKLSAELGTAVLAAENPKTYAAVTVVGAGMGALACASTAYILKKCGANVSPKLMAKVGAATAVANFADLYLKGRSVLKQVKQRMER